MKAQSILTSLEGTYCCNNDWHLTLQEFGTNLSSLLGYSSEEMTLNFHDQLLECIVPESQSSVRQELMEQLTKNHYAELEFQMRHKDGHKIWVLNKCKCLIHKDGTESICGILTDISKYKTDLEATRKTLQQFQIILAQTENIVFELNYKTDTITFSDSWEHIFGYAPRTHHFLSDFVSKSHLHPDDISTFLEQLQILQNGSGYQMIEARIEKADGSYIWCRIRATGIYDASNTIIKIIGIIINIDTEKKAAYELLERAEQDPLTRLLNNGTARHQAEEYLNSFPAGAHCALIILDLDNFKQINDHHGHMFGDKVLVNTANEIKKLFRTNDIIARIGGDEFLILMKDVSDYELVKKRCQQLVDSIHSFFNQEISCCNSSCSIGIAFAPIHGISYDHLFQLADHALYDAKKLGKNRYAIYNENID